MNDAILAAEGTVMQFVGDAVMAVFGAPIPQADHADKALAAAAAMHAAQAGWTAGGRVGLAPFGIGIGLSTGQVAAALLGSEERLEYTMVGDTVNLSQRLQDVARPGGTTVLSEATLRALATPPCRGRRLARATVKGRSTPVTAWRVPPVAA